MPALTELADLHALADAARRAAPLHVAVDEDAEVAMSASLDSTGLLLLGEVHGVRQTPRVIAALVELLDVHTVALEWPAMGAWLAGERPGLRSVRINYGDGVVYNLGPTPITARDQPMGHRVRLAGDRLLLDHPDPVEADVPHRPDLFTPGEPP